MSRALSWDMAKWNLLMASALIAVLLIAMSGGSYARANGAPVEVLTFVELQEDGVDGVSGLNGASSVVVSPDGSHIYAAGKYDDAVVVFSRDSETGTLTFVEFHQDDEKGVDGLDAVASLAMSPDGNHLYAAGHTDDAVAVFSRNSETGVLTFVEFHKDGVNGIDGLDGAFSVTVSPDGSHLYVAGRSDNAVAVFSRHTTTGTLIFLERYTDGDGDIDGLDDARSVTVSPDGNHLYAAAYNDDAVAMFIRDSETGALTFVEVYKDGDGDIDGLDGAWSVTVSPDGSYLYASSIVDDAVAVFNRDSETGVLTFAEVHKDGVGGVDGLAGVFSVTTDPYGSRLYAAGATDDAVAVFSRDWATGALAFVEVHKDGEAGVDGLNGASSVTVSPDGSHLYAAGPLDGAVAVFKVRRDDIEVSKSVDDSLPLEGDTVTFTVTATNNGSSPATGVVVTDALPSGLTLQSSNPSKGTYSIETGNWTLGSALVMGESATLTLVATVDGGTAGSPITNTASITASDKYDQDPSNDTASAALIVNHTCNGLPATHRGTEGVDIIVGSSGNDVIHAWGGDDMVLGMGGNDVICGGDGDDTIIGGDGKDRIWGGNGEDVLRGGRGRDRLYGGKHDDVLKGGRHNDRLHGGNGNDILVGGSGKDKLYGKKGDDTLSGGDGDDSHNCGPGTDMANGGSGTDTATLDCENTGQMIP